MCKLVESKVGDHTSEDAHFRQSAFFPIVDSVVSGLTVRFKAVETICAQFKFVWTYLSMINDDLEKESTCFAEEYSFDITKEILKVIEQLKEIYEAN